MSTLEKHSPPLLNLKNCIKIIGKMHGITHDYPIKRPKPTQDFNRPRKVTARRPLITHERTASAIEKRLIVRAKPCQEPGGTAPGLIRHRSDDPSDSVHRRRHPKNHRLVRHTLKPENSPAKAPHSPPAAFLPNPRTISHRHQPRNSYWPATQSRAKPQRPPRIEAASPVKLEPAGHHASKDQRVFTRIVR